MIHRHSGLSPQGGNFFSGSSLSLWLWYYLALMRGEEVTIEEKIKAAAETYVDKAFCDGDASDTSTFIAGANFMREEMESKLALAERDDFEASTIRLSLEKVDLEAKLALAVEALVTINKFHETEFQSACTAKTALDNIKGESE